MTLSGTMPGCTRRCEACLRGEEAEQMMYVKLLIFGGPCRGRTYGPLIKSRIKGIFTRV
jgi:hypothetical protein